MQTSSTYVRELVNITEVVKKWRQYLLRHKYRVFTDHHILKHLPTQTIQTPEHHKWVTKLIGYNFELHYKSGRENRVADTLIHIEQPTLLVIIAPKASLLNELRSYFKNKLEGQTIINESKTTQARYHYIIWRRSTVHRGSTTYTIYSIS